MKNKSVTYSDHISDRIIGYCPKCGAEMIVGYTTEVNCVITPIKNKTNRSRPKGGE